MKIKVVVGLKLTGETSKCEDYCTNVGNGGSRNSA